MRLDRCHVCKSKRFRKLYEKYRYNVVECKKCGFIYISNPPSDYILKEYYKKSDYPEKEKEKIIRKDAKHSINVINKYHRGDISLLDIGCGRGYFIDESRIQGWEAAGIDASVKAVAYAKSKLKLNVKLNDIYKAKLNNKYNLITLNQIIEHTNKPDTLLKICYKLLKKESMLYITTPNINSISSKVHKDKFDYIIPPEHLGFYSIKTLTKLLTDNKFEIKYRGSWSYSTELAGIIKFFIKPKLYNRDIYKAINNRSNISNVNNLDRIKYTLFDRIFCNIFYRLLSFNSFGGILEVLAVKK